jgi:hypothetical protein
MAESYSGFIQSAFITEERTNTLGRNVIDIKFKQFEEVRLRNISIRDKVFKTTEMKEWVFDFVDASSGAMYKLTLSNSIAFAVMNALLNVDKLGILKFVPKLKTTAAGADVTNVYVYNDNEYVSWKYSIEEMPPMQEIKVKTKHIGWNDDDRYLFFEEKIKDVLAKIPSHAPTSKPEPAAAWEEAPGVVHYAAPAEQMYGTNKDDDEVPF